MVGLKDGSRAYNKSYHGNQMIIRVIIGVPMEGSNDHASYDVQMRKDNVKPLWDQT
jgi:hypothetical protein